eukprot:Hpha_TRINITY_DN3033_c0_g1::TRINITY_DN3033_c0_g1_i1::g.138603::m.138603
MQLPSGPVAVAAGGITATALVVGCCALRRGGADDSDDEGDAAFASRHVELDPPAPPPKVSAQQRRIDLQVQKLLEKERREEEEASRRLLEAQAAKAEARGAKPRSVETEAGEASANAQGSSPTKASPTGSPEREKYTCAVPPGSIQREERTLVAEVRPERRRRNFPRPPPADERPGVDSIWADVPREEWYHRYRDATRWAWFDFTVVDSRGQIVSVQHEYVHPNGLRIVLLPTLRLADAQFFDSVAEEMERHNAFVLAETLHSVADIAGLAKQQELQDEHYQKEKPETVREIAFMSGGGNRNMDSTTKRIGGACVALEYLRVLINYQLRWKLADPPLDYGEMQTISTDVNTREAFAAVCQKREQFLFECIGEMIDAAEDPEWRTPAGGRTVALPWNGRHCVRLERYLVQCRGMEPDPAKCVHRIIFDPAQTAQMVRSANGEDDELDKAQRLKEQAEAEAKAADVVNFSPRAMAQAAALPESAEASPAASPRESTPGGSSGARVSGRGIAELPGEEGATAEAGG